MISAAKLALALGKPRKEGGGWRCLCPAHEDHEPSLSITEKGSQVLLNCRAGCPQDAVIEALKTRGLWNGQDKERHPERIYDYRDDEDRLRYQVVRHGLNGADKKFAQRRPNGAGGWIWNMQDVDPLPYRLPRMLAGEDATIFIAEGEKDCDNLAKISLVATTNHGGAGQWRSEISIWLKDRDVVILPDNDDLGRKHAASVARHLTGIASRVRILALPGLAEKGDVSDWLAAGGTRERLLELASAISPYNNKDDDEILAPPGQPKVRSAGRDDGSIPPRDWLLGTNFCRGFLSGLTGPGATGKTAIRLLQFIALALGRGDLVGEQVFERTRVLLVCLEDDEMEVRRRIRAVCIHHKLDERDLDGWLYYWTPHDLRFLEIDQRGRPEPGGLGDALRRIIKHLGIGLVGVDPFVKSHSANENDNTLVGQAASLFLQVAYDCGCACDYVHHHRKGITIAGDPDSGRGASSLRDASRLVKTATKMTEEEAKELGVSESDRKYLVRIDDAKLNIAPPAAATVWFKLVGVDIGNATEKYPRGDNVQTVERWHPPAAGNGLAKSALAEIFEALRAGPNHGEFYSAHANAKANWVGEVIIKFTGMEEPGARRLLRDWIKNSVLIEDEHMSPKSGKFRKRVILNEVKAAEILGSLYRPANTGFADSPIPPYPL
jgi:hypothetical protein